MAVAEMRKLNLVAMSYDKDRILNALQRTGAAKRKKTLDPPRTEETNSAPNFRALLARSICCARK